MTGRPLHALLLPPAAAGRLLDALASALDGSGPAVLPLDPRLPRARVAALLEAFAPAAVETPEGTRRWQPACAAGAGHGSRNGNIPAEVAVVIATSGSTGEPKGAQLAAGALLHSARASLDRIGARAGERWLCPLPTSHVAGLGILVRSLVSGTTPVVVPRLDDGAGPAAAGCAHTSLVPTQLRRLLAAGADLARFGTILLGGAAVPAGLLAAARAAGARVVTTYGMTETCGGCVYDGVPLEGVSVRTGTDGRIEITGPVLFSGYRLRPDLTGHVMARHPRRRRDGRGPPGRPRPSRRDDQYGGREGRPRRGRRGTGAVPRGPGGGGDRGTRPGVGGTGQSPTWPRCAASARGDADRNIGCGGRQRRGRRMTWGVGQRHGNNRAHTALLNSARASQYQVIPEIAASDAAQFAAIGPAMHCGQRAPWKGGASCRGTHPLDARRGPSRRTWTS